MPIIVPTVLGNTTALEIITDAYGRCNRLSPGETLGADDAASAFQTLNMLVDEMSVQNVFLFENIITSATQTGDITLGVGSWSTIAPGTEIISATANSFSLSPMTMQQFNGLYSPRSSGTPGAWAFDGLTGVFFDIIPNAVVIKLQTRSSVSIFSDQTTEYAMPAGYKSYMGAALAVRIAPRIMGKIPQYLIDAERSLGGNVAQYLPSIINVHSFTKPRYRNGNILNGW